MQGPHVPGLFQSATPSAVIRNRIGSSWSQKAATGNPASCIINHQPNNHTNKKSNDCKPPHVSGLFQSATPSTVIRNRIGSSWSQKAATGNPASCIINHQPNNHTNEKNNDCKPPHVPGLFQSATPSAVIRNRIGSSWSQKAATGNPASCIINHQPNNHTNEKNNDCKPPYVPGLFQRATPSAVIRNRIGSSWSQKAATGNPASCIINHQTNNHTNEKSNDCKPPHVSGLFQSATPSAVIRNRIGSSWSQKAATGNPASCIINHQPNNHTNEKNNDCKPPHVPGLFQSATPSAVIRNRIGSSWSQKAATGNPASCIINHQPNNHTNEKNNDCKPPHVPGLFQRATPSAVIRNRIGSSWSQKAATGNPASCIINHQPNNHTNEKNNDCKPPYVPGLFQRATPSAVIRNRIGSSWSQKAATGNPASCIINHQTNNHTNEKSNDCKPPHVSGLFQSATPSAVIRNRIGSSWSQKAATGNPASCIINHQPNNHTNEKNNDCKPPHVSGLFQSATPSAVIRNRIGSSWSQKAATGNPASCIINHQPNNHTNEKNNDCKPPHVSGLFQRATPSAVIRNRIGSSWSQKAATGNPASCIINHQPNNHTNEKNNDCKPPHVPGLFQRATPSAVIRNRIGSSWSQKAATGNPASCIINHQPNNHTNEKNNDCKPPHVPGLFQRATPSAVIRNRIGSSWSQKAATGNPASCIINHQPNNHINEKNNDCKPPHVPGLFQSATPSAVIRNRIGSSWSQKAATGNPASCIINHQPNNHTNEKNNDCKPPYVPGLFQRATPSAVIRNRIGSSWSQKAATGNPASCIINHQTNNHTNEKSNDCKPPHVSGLFQSATPSAVIRNRIGSSWSQKAATGNPASCIINHQPNNHTNEKNNDCKPPHVSGLFQSATPSAVIRNRIGSSWSQKAATGNPASCIINHQPNNHTNEKNNDCKPPYVPGLFQRATPSAVIRNRIGSSWSQKAATGNPASCIINHQTNNHTNEKSNDCKPPHVSGLFQSATPSAVIRNRIGSSWSQKAATGNPASCIINHQPNNHTNEKNNDCKPPHVPGLFQSATPSAVIRNRIGSSWSQKAATGNPASCIINHQPNNHTNEKNNDCKPPHVSGLFQRATPSAVIRNRIGSSWSQKAATGNPASCIINHQPNNHTNEKNNDCKPPHVPGLFQRATPSAVIRNRIGSSWSQKAATGNPASCIINHQPNNHTNEKNNDCKPPHVPGLFQRATPSAVIRNRIGSSWSQKAATGNPASCIINHQPNNHTNEKNNDCKPPHVSGLFQSATPSAVIRNRIGSSWSQKAATGNPASCIINHQPNNHTNEKNNDCKPPHVPGLFQRATPSAVIRNRIGSSWSQKAATGNPASCIINHQPNNHTNEKNDDCKPPHVSGLFQSATPSAVIRNRIGSSWSQKAATGNPASCIINHQPNNHTNKENNDCKPPDVPGLFQSATPSAVIRNRIGSSWSQKAATGNPASCIINHQPNNHTNEKNNDCKPPHVSGLFQSATPSAVIRNRFGSSWSQKAATGNPASCIINHQPNNHTNEKNNDCKPPHVPGLFQRATPSAVIRNRIGSSWSQKAATGNPASCIINHQPNNHTNEKNNDCKPPHVSGLFQSATPSAVIRKRIGSSWSQKAATGNPASCIINHQPNNHTNEKNNDCKPPHVSGLFQSATPSAVIRNRIGSSWSQKAATGNPASCIINHQPNNHTNEKNNDCKPPHVSGLFQRATPSAVIRNRIGSSWSQKAATGNPASCIINHQPNNHTNKKNNDCKPPHVSGLFQSATPSAVIRNRIGSSWSQKAATGNPASCITKHEPNNHTNEKNNDCKPPHVPGLFQRATPSAVIRNRIGSSWSQKAATGNPASCIINHQPNNHTNEKSNDCKPPHVSGLFQSATPSAAIRNRIGSSWSQKAATGNPASCIINHQPNNHTNEKNNDCTPPHVSGLFQRATPSAVIRNRIGSSWSQKAATGNPASCIINHQPNNHTNEKNDDCKPPHVPGLFQRATPSAVIRNRIGSSWSQKAATGNPASCIINHQPNNHTNKKNNDCKPPHVSGLFQSATPSAVIRNRIGSSWSQKAATGNPASCIINHQPNNHTNKKNNDCKPPDVPGLFQSATPSAAIRNRIGSSWSQKAATGNPASCITKHEPNNHTNEKNNDCKPPHVPGLFQRATPSAVIRNRIGSSWSQKAATGNPASCIINHQPNNHTNEKSNDCKPPHVSGLFQRATPSAVIRNRIGSSWSQKAATGNPASCIINHQPNNHTNEKNNDCTPPHVSGLFQRATPSAVIRNRIGSSWSQKAATGNPASCIINHQPNNHTNEKNDDCKPPHVPGLFQRATPSTVIRNRIGSSWSQKAATGNPASCIINHQPNNHTNEKNNDCKPPHVPGLFQSATPSAVIRNRIGSSWSQKAATGNPASCIINHQPNNHTNEKNNDCKPPHVPGLFQRATPSAVIRNRIRSSWSQKAATGNPASCIINHQPNNHTNEKNNDCKPPHVPGLFQRATPSAVIRNRIGSSWSQKAATGNPASCIINHQPNNHTNEKNNDCKPPHVPGLFQRATPSAVIRNRIGSSWSQKAATGNPASCIINHQPNNHTNEKSNDCKPPHVSGLFQSATPSAAIRNRIGSSWSQKAATGNPASCIINHQHKQPHQ